LLLFTTQCHLVKPVYYSQETDLGFSKLSETGRYTAIGTWGAFYAHLVPLCAVSERKRPCEETSENQIVPVKKT